MTIASDQRRAGRTKQAQPASGAVILVGHGSLRPDGGAAMIRLAERAQAAGVAPTVAAGFLNYSRPTFAEALARCVAAGAADIIAQPYFLVPGKFVRDDFERLLETGRLAHPGLQLRGARPFGDHPALARLLLKRALEADYRFAHPELAGRASARLPGQGAGWQPLCQRQRAGLLIMAHGSPDPRANLPIESLVRQIRASSRYMAVADCYLGLNAPSIPDALAEMVRAGATHIIAAPYFLHMGNHVREDLPELIESARARHPHCQIILAEHLGYDRLLVPVIADRVAELRG